MHKLLLLLAAVPALGLAQQTGQATEAPPTEGQIIYEETMDFGIDRRMKRMESRLEEMGGDEETMKAIAERMKAMQHSEKILYFTATESLYQAYENPDKPETDASSGATMSFMKPEYNVYQNLAEKKAVNQQDFMGKKFLIHSDMNDIQWKLTGESDTIAGYVCQKATAVKDTLAVTAWFTMQIPVPAGPLGFGQLPGMILKLEVEGKYQVTAKTIEFKKPEKGVIAAPTKGKEVTQEEYVEIVKEKMKEMREMYGGRDGVRVITR